MDKITIADLEVSFRVGVPDEERAQPQRLTITVAFDLDFTAAVAWEDLSETIDYGMVVQAILAFGEEKEWRLIEKLGSDLATMLLEEFSAVAVTVEVKKFIIPQARYVSITLTRASARIRPGPRTRR